MAIIRVKKSHFNFTIIRNEILEDSELSFKAKGLLCFLLSKPDHWEINVNHLVKVSKEGRDAIYSVIKELDTAGYINRSMVKDEKGRVVRYQYDIYDDKTKNPDNPLRENPKVENPVGGKPDISKDLLSTNTELSKGDKSPDKKKKVEKTIRERKVDFLAVLIKWVLDNPGKYPKLMIQEFAKYWIEETLMKTKVKLRFEEQNFFNVGRRLGTWFKNCKDIQIAEQWSKDQALPTINEIFNNLLNSK